MKKRTPTFNYILNDLALYNLADKCLFGYPTDQEKFDLRNQIVRLVDNNSKLTKYNNKLLENRIRCDNRNYRQKRVNAENQQVIVKYKESLEMQTRISERYKKELKNVHDRLVMHPEDFPKIIQHIEKVVEGKNEVFDD